MIEFTYTGDCDCNFFFFFCGLNFSFFQGFLLRFEFVEVTTPQSGTPEPVTGIITIVEPLKGILAGVANLKNVLCTHVWGMLTLICEGVSRRDN